MLANINYLSTVTPDGTRSLPFLPADQVDFGIIRAQFIFGNDDRPCLPD